MKIFKVLTVTLLSIISLSLLVLVVSTTSFRINLNENGLGHMFSWKKFSEYKEKIVYKHDDENCECMALLTEDMMKENMVYMYVKKIGDWTYEFEHHYEDGEIVRYTHKWE